MWRKQIWCLFLGFSSLLFISCENVSSTTESQEMVFMDSISYWLSKSNASNDRIYSDNLQKALSAVALETNDTIKSKYSLDLSYAYFRLNDSVNFKKANTIALVWAKKLKDSSKMASAYWDAGDFHDNRGQADSAYYNYAQAHKLYKDLRRDYNSARMLYSMARALSTIKDYTAAETYTIEAIALLKPLENKNKVNKLYNCYNFLGVISNNLKEYDKALEYHNQALEYLETIANNSIDVARSQNNIGSVYLSQKKYDLALKQFLTVSKTDSLYEKDPVLYAMAIGNWGYSQFKLGDTINVLSKFNIAIKIKDSIGDTKALSRSYYTMSEFLLAAKDTVGALAYAKRAKKASQTSDNNLRVLETLNLLTQIDPKNATTYFQDYAKLNDSLQTVERRARNKFERIRFETNETLAENVLLSRRNQMWIIIAGVFLFVAVSTYFIINQRRKNEKLRFQEEQQKNNQQIFNLLLSENTKIEEGKKLAQKRISEELHDTVQSRLQGIRMLLLGLNKYSTPEAIAERGDAIKELKNVQEEVRAISHEISHAAYQRIYGFISTIQELLNGVHKNSKLESEFLFDEDVDWDNLDSDIKINVYRIIQESIQNCVKYADAEQVKVNFDYIKNQMLKVSISDNGKGFRVKSKPKGIGMRNINSRVEKLGGKWEIQSKIGEGTKVILYIPTLIK